MNQTLMPDFLSSKESYRVQKTLSSSIEFNGVGLHSGKLSHIRLCPAPVNHGIIFERTDGVPAIRIPAHFNSVVSTSMATSLGILAKPETTIATVEHLMAAVYGMGITNLLIEVSGPEIPILDGSALPFIEMISKVGIELQNYTQSILKVLKPIKVYKDGTICELLPRDRLRLTTSVDFPHPLIGMQTFALELSPETFKNQVCRARTFGFQSDLDKLRLRNLAQGASLENVLAFSDSEILNPEGARFPDECVRHKLLDAIGDLALFGSWIEGELVSFRGGHSIHLTLLKSLEQFSSHWEIIPALPLHSVRTQTQPKIALSLSMARERRV